MLSPGMKDSSMQIYSARDLETMVLSYGHGYNKADFLTQGRLVKEGVSIVKFRFQSFFFL